MSDSAASPPRYLWVTPLIVVLAIALRVAGLPHEVPWHDEVLSLRFIDAPSLSDFLRQNFEHDAGVRPFPIYFIAEYTWASVLGPSVLSLRLFSVTCAIGALLFLMAIARRLYDRPTAWAAGFLFAVALPHIYFAQEIRFYALVTLLVSAACYCFVRAMMDSGRTWWYATFALNALMPWTHVYAPLIWIPQAVALLVFRYSPRRLVIAWLGAHASVCIAFALWMLNLDYAIEDEYVKQATPTYREFLNAFNVYAGGRFGKLDPLEYLPTHQSFDRVLSVILGLLLVALCTNFWRAPGEYTKRDREGLLFLLAWLTIPPVFLFLVSQIWKPLFVFRYTLYCSLAWYVLAGKALTSLHSPWARSCIAAMLLLIFGNQLTVLAKPFRPDYVAADQHIRSISGDDATVFVLKKLNGIPFAYNSALSDGRIHTFEGLGELYAAMELDLQSRSTAWLVLWQWDDFAVIEAYLTDQGYELDRREFSGVPPLVVYRVTVT